MSTLSRPAAPVLALLSLAMLAAFAVAGLMSMPRQSEPAAATVAPPPASAVPAEPPDAEPAFPNVPPGS